MAPDDIVEVEFAEGERLWMRGDEYRLRFGGVERGAEDGVLPVPSQVNLLPAGMATRGPVAWVVKGLKVFGVDLTGKAAEAFAKSVDLKKSKKEPQKRPGPGLYRCPLVSEQFALTPANVPANAGDAPWLLFIHGTGSSSWGSFGELWSPERKEQLQALRTKYQDRVLAFEHPTLSQSPAENARDLARALPKGARLHLVTHSRGGLVGELLSRGSVQADTAFDDEQLEIFISAERQEQAEMLRELARTLRDNQLVVERFVRVACPALGTTLASGRLDRWLSVIGSLAGAALPGSPLAEMFSDLADFVAAVVKERTDPKTLPGLEAMMPDSPFIKLVNWPEVTVGGDLAVVAGDIEPDAWWARLLVWLSDRFYDGDHDLVVNTPSMYGGARRAGRAMVSFHKAPAVNHFTYFKEGSSAGRLVSALTADDGTAPLVGFEPLRRPTVDIARAVAQRGTEAPRPVVFVLPGIMGSELQIEGSSIWLRLLALLRGGMARLDIKAPNVVANEVMAKAYGELIERLARTHKVVVFPYDWRLSPMVEADRLATRVRAELTEAGRLGQPVRILAHSMGGLVARTMIARHEALWRDVCAHPGARLVMLGTPNGGSHSITELLVGQSSTLRKLARLDSRHGVAGLLEILSRFPGILAMLPHDPHEDYFAAATWRTYRDATGGWSMPELADLEQARELRRVLETSPVDPARMLYVAGSADVTLAEMRLVRDTRRNRDEIQFLATTRGDGRVTWDSGIPPALAGRTWFMDVEHGNLAAHPPAFEALEELLEKGATALLPQTPPAARSATTLFPKPPAEDDRYPDEEDLAAEVLGASPRKHRLRAAPEHRLNVDVVHGNLAFARWPVAVGHYAGDTIVSAERHLDLALNGALSRRHQLRLYPAAIETNAVFINPRLKDDPHALPQGAIVVGLGPVGQLSAALLGRSFTRALLEYVLESSELPAKVEGTSRELGVSALLIGTGAGGISVSDSVFALLRGVLRANEILAAANQPARIADLEIIELWEDNAMQALSVLHRLEKEPELRGRFVLKSELSTGEGGLWRLFYEEPAGWWHRLQILGKPDPEKGADGSLRFAAVTRRARSEVRHLGTQRALIDQFVEDAARTTRADRNVSQTLFELLLPNDLKESAPDQDNLVLLVDAESAHYPWELLEDPRGDGGQPWAVKHGLLRQLESHEFRETVQGTLENNALVVGDPVSSFTELPGAQAEADAVWRALQPRFAAVKSIRENSRQVVTRLFARPYKVLHLAGHGVYNWTPGESITTAAAASSSHPASRRTGMVLGDGVFLTPGEVEQMRQVPELVFINCCFLGRVEDAPAPGAPDRQFHRLAANVATQFIRIGVRAVIAAGWAVDDDAATTFAATFYDQMLAGRPLGEAVRAARKATFDRHPGSNTWGAYQCYGDPDYRLMTLNDGAYTAGPELILLSHVQAVQELNNIVARLKTGSATGVEAERQRITEIHQKATERQWDKRGAVLAALAEAYGEANEFVKATELYENAIKAEDGEVMVKCFEQWVNLTSRDAVNRWRKGADAAQGIEKVRDIVKRYTELMDQLGWTPERQSILGSAYKRLAWLESSEPNRLKALKDMYKAYSQACGTTLNPYPVLNQLTAAIVLGWQGKTVKRSDLTDLLSRSRDELKKQLEQRRSFWPDVGLVDADLIGILAEGKLEKEAVAKLAAQYKQRRSYASAREFASVLDQLDFLIAMVPAGQADLARELASLRELVSGK